MPREPKTINAKLVTTFGELQKLVVAQVLVQGKSKFSLPGMVKKFQELPVSYWVVACFSIRWGNTATP